MANQVWNLRKHDVDHRNWTCRHVERGCWPGNTPKFPFFLKSHIRTSHIPHWKPYTCNIALNVVVNLDVTKDPCHLPCVLTTEFQNFGTFQQPSAKTMDGAPAWTSCFATPAATKRAAMTTKNTKAVEITFPTKIGLLSHLCHHLLHRRSKSLPQAPAQSTSRFRQQHPRLGNVLEPLLLHR